MHPWLSHVKTKLQQGVSTENYCLYYGLDHATFQIWQRRYGILFSALEVLEDDKPYTSRQILDLLESPSQECSKWFSLFLIRLPIKGAPPASEAYLGSDWKVALWSFEKALGLIDVAGHDTVDNMKVNPKTVTQVLLNQIIWNALNDIPTNPMSEPSLVEKVEDGYEITFSIFVYFWPTQLVERVLNGEISWAPLALIDNLDRNELYDFTTLRTWAMVGGFHLSNHEWDLLLKHLERRLVHVPVDDEIEKKWLGCRFRDYVRKVEAVG